MPVTKPCVVCGQPSKPRSPAAFDYWKVVYCSKRCLGIDRKGNKNKRFSGGRHVTAKGYVLALRPEHPNANGEGYVFEHRLVMEQTLGRLLTKDERVHHINGKRDDNRPENLELFGDNIEHLAHSHTRPPCWCGKPHYGRGVCRNHWRQLRDEELRRAPEMKRQSFAGRLSNADVHSMRTLALQGAGIASLAKQFGVHRSTIARVLNGQRRAAA